MKLKLHHVNFASTNVEAMDDFYRKVLDLEPEATLGRERVTSQGYPGKVAFVTDGAMQIHLAEKDIEHRPTGRRAIAARPRPTSSPVAAAADQS